MVKIFWKNNQIINAFHIRNFDIQKTKSEQLMMNGFIFQSGFLTFTTISLLQKHQERAIFFLHKTTS